MLPATEERRWTVGMMGWMDEVVDGTSVGCVWLINVYLSWCLSMDTQVFKELTFKSSEWIRRVFHLLKVPTSEISIVSHEGMVE